MIPANFADASEDMSGDGPARYALDPKTTRRLPALFRGRNIPTHIAGSVGTYLAIKSYGNTQSQVYV
jgi:hypothetical protein